MRFLLYGSFLPVCLVQASVFSILAPEPPIVLPLAPVAPPPAPAAAATLSGDQVYDVLCRVDCVVRVYPPGIVSPPSQSRKVLAAGKEFEKEANFVDGTKTKTWTGPCTLYFLKAVGKGRVYVDVIPKGFTDETQIVSFVLDVDAGIGPRPPPPDPDPKPDPKPQPVVSFRVIWVFESGTTPTPGQVSVMDAKAVRDYLNLKTTKEGTHPGWRKYDPNINTTNEQPVMKALWTAVKPKITVVPCMVVELNGKADILPFPASSDEALKTLKSYGGE